MRTLKRHNEIRRRHRSGMSARLIVSDCDRLISRRFIAARCRIIFSGWLGWLARSTIAQFAVARIERNPTTSSHTSTAPGDKRGWKIEDRRVISYA